MSHIASNLLPGEAILLSSGKSKFACIPAFALGFLGILLSIDWGSSGSSADSGSSSLWGAVAIILAVYLYLDWRSHEYAITDRRAIRKSGILSVKTDEISMEKMEGVSMSKSLLLPYGDVSIQGT